MATRLGATTPDDRLLATLTTGCVTQPGPVQAAAELVFALTEEVDPAHAPLPHNLAERVVFRNLYETLLQVDCTGALKPGLAVAWERRNGGTTWVLRLRPGAVFWAARR